MGPKFLKVALVIIAVGFICGIVNAAVTTQNEPTATAQVAEAQSAQPQAVAAEPQVAEPQTSETAAEVNGANADEGGTPAQSIPPAP